MNKKFKKGAASFYIVAFSTLILMIVAISFAAVIISEVERTSNDDLSQSAYDSALAGIEDAKLAYYNYLNCRTKGLDGSSNYDATNCPTVVSVFDDGLKKLKDSSSEAPCDMVWKMLGRNDNYNGNITESNTATNNMQQYTTCVTMSDQLDNYSGSLSPSKGVDVVHPKFGSDSVDYSADYIEKIVLKWYSSENASTYGFNNTSSGSTRVFPIASGLPIAPPILSFTILQTGPTFTMSSFNDVKGDQTNRGTIYLVPSASGNTSVSKTEIVGSNNKKLQKTAHKVSCARDEDYLCSVTIDLPKPIGGTRNSDTFEVVLNMPYGQFETDFLMEFYCKMDTPCYSKQVTTPSGETTTQPSTATLKGVQLEIDSTGRANDLYRRVVARLKSKTDIDLSVMGPLELLGKEDGDGLTKDMSVTKEYNFND